MLDFLRQIDFSVIKNLNQLVISHAFLESLTLVFARYGVFIFVLLGFYALEKKHFRTVFTSALTIGLCGFINSLVYLVWNRPRPFVAHAAEIHSVGLMVQPESFPSNHAFITFGVATAFWLTGQKKVAVFLYVLAILITLARIAGGVHYPSDIIGGAILGIVVAPLALQTYKLITGSRQKEVFD
jgi:undecaprenyl-diphosphatase